MLGGGERSMAIGKILKEALIDYIRLVLQPESGQGSRSPGGQDQRPESSSPRENSGFCQALIIDRVLNPTPGPLVLTLQTTLLHATFDIGPSSMPHPLSDSTRHYMPSSPCNEPPPPTHSADTDPNSVSSPLPSSTSLFSASVSPSTPIKYDGIYAAPYLTDSWNSCTSISVPVTLAYISSYLQFFYQETHGPGSILMVWLCTPSPRLSVSLSTQAPDPCWTSAFVAHSILYIDDAHAGTSIICSGV
ncbi:hypothetical protein BDR04DRAFT_1162211 [Suillus decipiens]|nr:hypothetical protein BDR04DRAFT_1162211 [Suillus decipiens]